MYILITYDVDTTSKAGERRLRCVAKACQDYGQRVQNSVFECELTESQLATLKGIITAVIDKDKDSVRIYYLHKNDARRVELIGRETSFKVTDVMII